MFRIFILLSSVVAVFSQSFKMHEQMTPEEVQTIFGSNHNSIPEYEIVPIAHAFHKKSKNHRIVQLTSFEKPMTLYLEPTDGYLAGVNTPVFTAKSNSNLKSNLEYKRIPKAIKPGQHNLFQDILNLAAFVINHDKKGLALIDGIINDLAIRPLPERFRNQFKRSKRNAQNQYIQSNHSDHYTNLEETHHHVVYKIPTSEVSSPLSRAFNGINQGPKLNKIPNIIYPQILIVVEASLFDIFKKDVNSIVSYILSFWNGVDLRYRAFQHPDVRLNIGGIILAEDHNVTSYIAKNHVNIPTSDDIKISVQEALREKSRVFYPETQFNKRDNSLSMKGLGFKFDLVVTMTPFDMCQFEDYCLEDEEYVCEPNPYEIKRRCVTLGLAYHTGACAYNATSELMEAVAIVEDKGGFGGIIPAAHEIGHLLGASHNARTSECEVADGYIMSYRLKVSRKSFLWSDCSVRTIKKFLQSEERAQCLFNKPYRSNQVARILPGKFFSRDEQCGHIMGTRSCRNPEFATSCEKLYCEESLDSSECVPAESTAVAEGTDCGKGLYCINAQCVSKSKKWIQVEIGTERPQSNY